MTENELNSAIYRTLVRTALPELAAKYDKKLVLHSARISYFDASDIELLFVLSNYLKWGPSRELTFSDLSLIFREVRQLKNELTPFGNEPNALPFLRNLRAFRPHWFIIPIYKEILSHFDDQTKDLIGFSSSEIFDSLKNVIDNSNDITREYEPEIMKVLWDKYSVYLSDLRTFGDIWDKALIKVDNEFKVGLPYKLPETVNCVA